MTDSERWERAYRSGTLPWDTGRVCPHLIGFVDGRGLHGGRALDIGCGTGTNAVWLAQRGFDVRGVDVSALAIDRARARAAQAGVSVAFEVADVLSGTFSGAYDLVFDRGVWHVFDEPADRARFAEVVAELLAPGGHWLSVSGSTEGPPRDGGPPRRTLRDVAEAIEPYLAFREVRSVTFGDTGEWPDPALAWAAVMSRRMVPAQPFSGADLS